MRLQVSSIGTKVMISVAGVLILLMAVNLLWNIDRQRQQTRDQLRQEALIIAQQLLATRAFIAESQQKINFDSQGRFEFKHLNPASVGRGIGNIMSHSTQYSFKQTNLTVRNKDNIPDFFEWDRMMKLKGNPQLTESYGEDIVNDKKVFRYMLPLYYEAACLDCHGGLPGEIDVAGYAKEGGQLGDFAGTLSIVVPMGLYEANLQKNIVQQVTFIFVSVILTIGCIFLLTSKLITRPLSNLVEAAQETGAGNLGMRIPLRNTEDEIDLLAQAFNVMAGQLQILYTNLEYQVETRTFELTEANRQLAEQQSVLKELNAKLSEADHLKSQFLASMSHELRTPLTAIIAFAELLLKTPHGLTDIQKEYLQDILDSGQQLLCLINDLLDYSKIEAGLLQIRPGVVDITELLSGMEKTLKPWAQKKEIQLRVFVEPNAPVVFGDFEKLKRVLLNLVSNAIKFTPEGGLIKVTAEFAATEPNSALRIVVSDNGIGIKEQDLPHIFEAFWQADCTASRQYQGTGLGLSLVKSIIEKHGGQIWVESEWGHGSSFVVILPL